MSLEQMRDDFEQALAAFAKLPHGHAQFKSYRSDDQRYANAHGVARAELEIGWWAWQASRAAVVVELPEPAPLGDCSPPGLEYGEVVEAIEAAGVKVAT